MKEDIVRFDTAELAREKGFDIGDDNSVAYSLKDKTIHRAEYLSYNDIAYAPTQSLLQKWLREEHNCFITVFLCGGEKYDEPFYPYDSFSQSEIFFTICIHYKGESKWINNKDYSSNTYEEALETGLIEALTLIK